MGEGRWRVKGRDVVSSEFENSAGRNSKEQEGGREGTGVRKERRGGEERG